jgi:biopolymer transport protein TolQ
MTSHGASIGLFGGLGTVSQVILMILLSFSIVSWAIIIYKWRVYRASDDEDRQFLNTYARAQDRDDLRRHARRFLLSPCAALFIGVMDRISPEPEGFSAEGLSRSILDSGQDAAPADRQYLDRVVAHIVQDQISKHESYLPFLATTGNITPFVGLLGTVLGIIDAFREIGKQGTASIAAVAPGVSEALVATAAGLFAAIPAVIAYNYFLSRIRKMSFRVEAFSIEFLNTVQVKAKQTVRG